MNEQTRAFNVGGSCDVSQNVKYRPQLCHVTWDGWGRWRTA